MSFLGEMFDRLISLMNVHLRVYIKDNNTLTNVVIYI